MPKATITIKQSEATIDGDNMPLKEFARGTTVIISGTIKIDGAVQDITSDTVTLTLKKKKDDLDTAAPLQENADVSGGGGAVTFTLLPTETDIPARRYFYDILWVTSAAAEYVLESEEVQVKPRVSDV